MNHIGPAAVTLAALCRLALKSGETFASSSVIADVACLKEWTTKQHLRQLVKSGWLEYMGRRHRRTATYRVDMDLVNRSGARKFCLLPRWAAKMLPTWAERAVFACIISRDSLCDYINGDEDGSDDDGHPAYERREYSLASIAKDSGLTRPSIIQAKRRLLDRGLITIDRSAIWEHCDGTFYTTSDAIRLNPEFGVPVGLIERRKRRPAQTVNGQSGNSTPGKKTHRIVVKNSTAPKEKKPTATSKEFHRLLNSTSKSIS